MRLPKRVRRRSEYATPRTPVGSSPGTISVPHDALKPTIKILAYGPDKYIDETVEDLAVIPKLLKTWPCTWIQVIGVGDPRVLQEFGEIFHLHRLSLEDVSHLHQRPKIEQYGDHFFIIARLVERLGISKSSEQISIFLGSKYVLSFQEREVHLFDPVKQRIRLQQGRIRDAGPDYLCYAMIDCIVDHYFPALDSCGERLNAIEDNMFNSTREQVLTELHSMRHELLTMRRAIWPMREVINSMQRETSNLFAHETKIHLRDCYDHAVQIIDLVESYRELSASLMEVSLSLMSHRLNEGIRILTVISTIFIPLNFVVGVYGMNFDTTISQWNMPELKWPLGYLFVWGVMMLITFAQMYFFWRRGWLRSDKGVL